MGSRAKAQSKPEEEACEVRSRLRHPEGAPLLVANRKSCLVRWASTVLGIAVPVCFWIWIKASIQEGQETDIGGIIIEAVGFGVLVLAVEVIFHYHQKHHRDGL